MGIGTPVNSVLVENIIHVLKTPLLATMQSGLITSIFGITEWTCKRSGGIITLVAGFGFLLNEKRKLIKSPRHIFGSQIPLLENHNCRQFHHQNPIVFPNSKGKLLTARPPLLLTLMVKNILPIQAIQLLQL